MYRFNGAAAFQPRNYPVQRLDALGAGASMGPQHFSRGIIGIELIYRYPFIASMGPQHFSRGIFLADGSRPFPCNASMGPQHFSRGIGIRYDAVDATYRGLQWGRSISAAELGFELLTVGVFIPASMGPQHFSRGINLSAYRMASSCWLQWGRSISAAELRRASYGSAWKPRFNGAAAFQPRN